MYACMHIFECVCMFIAKLKAQKLPIQFIQHFNCREYSERDSGWGRSTRLTTRSSVCKPNYALIHTHTHVHNVYTSVCVRVVSMRHTHAHIKITQAHTHAVIKIQIHNHFSTYAYIQTKHTDVRTYINSWIDRNDGVLVQLSTRYVDFYCCQLVSSTTYTPHTHTTYIYMYVCTAV